MKIHSYDSERIYINFNSKFSSTYKDFLNDEWGEKYFIYPQS